VRSICSMAAMLTVLTAPVHANEPAWVMKPGAVETGFSFSRVDTRQAFLADGTRGTLFATYQRQRDGEYASNIVRGEVLYGAADDFTLIGSVAFHQSNSQYADSLLVQRPNSGLGDIYLAGRYSLVNGTIGSAIQVGWKIPAADTGSVSAVALGNGTMDFEVTACGGWCERLAGVTTLMQATAGYRFRGGGYGDELLFGVEAQAWVVGERIGVRIAVDGRLTQGEVLAPPATGNSSGFGFLMNTSSTSVATGVGVRLSQKMRADVSWRTVVAGENAMAGNTVLIGVTLTPFHATPISPR
jgi:hypothetical protein